MTLFEIAITEPRTDLFLAYVDGRLSARNPELLDELVKHYQEWKGLVP